MRIGNRCGKSRCTDRPDAGDRHETPCNIVATKPNGQIAINLTESDV